MKIGGKKWKAFMAKLYGMGAAVVIIGAMFKIQHWPGAGPMLVVGLTVEAIIFFFSAFEPPHEDPDWSLVYPELAGMHGDEGHGHGEKKIAKTGDSVSQELDKLLEEAKIGPELIESLGTGLRSLSDQASKLTDITDASVATNQYVNNVKSASESVGELSRNYAKASEALTGLSLTNEDGQNYGQQLSKASQNLSSLNAVYELQLVGANNQLKATENLYNGISDMIKNLSDSVEDTRRYKTEVSQLAQNLSALNTVYGNMLTAMNYKG
jgi:gliding motility-associated protein GldL